MVVGLKMKLLFILAAILICICDARKKPYAYTDHAIDPKYDNPNFVKDRYKSKIPRPTVPQHWYFTFKENYSYPAPPPRPDFFDPTIHDKCNPNNCIQYYNPVCGFNRKNINFRWFDSMCHLILNNICANALGTLKYNPIKYGNCIKYVYIRSEDCPKTCSNEVDPFCAQSKVDGHIVVFKNACFMSLRNCDPGQLPDEYQQISADYCSDMLQNALK